MAEPAAARLAAWACELRPTQDDRELAARALVDTVAVAYAARGDPIRPVAESLTQPGRWATLAHVLDYDDLHLESTAHLSAVCVPAALGAGGGARSYLAGAGVMARLGTALGWTHYSAGWHATCTAGAPGAAVAGAVARELDPERTAVAIALSIASAGGVQRAFGTAAKSLQVAAAVEAGLRAAALAQAGATADLRAVDDWMRLVRGDPDAVQVTGAAIPGGLAVKPYPCCYALQRPVAAARSLGALPVDRVKRIRVSTPVGTLTPLIHHDPVTGLEAKFSLEYGIAAALLDGEPGFDSFSDAGVARPQARELMGRVETIGKGAQGQDLLAGQVEIEVELSGGEVRRAELALPPGAPQRPLSATELEAKLTLCAAGAARELAGVTWDTAPGLLGGR